MRTGGHTLVLAVVAAACAGLWARPARAQAAVPPQGEFSAERFVPAIGPRNWLSVAGGRTEGDWAWSGGLVFDYARSPFVLRSCTSATDCSSPATADPEDLGVVEDLFTWHLLASVTKERLQLGVRLPLAFSTGAGFDAATGGSASDGLVAFGLGDPGLEAKVRIWGEPDSAIVLATAADLYAPLGHATASGSHIGNDSPLAGGLRAIMDAQFGRFHLGLNLGALLRRQATLGESSQGSELRYGAAGAMAVGPGIRILAETFGATGFSAQRGTNALEIDAGVEVPALDSGIILTAAMGTGVIRGIGVPLVRVVVGASFSSLRDGAAPKEPAPSAEPAPPPVEPEPAALPAEPAPPPPPAVKPAPPPPVKPAPPPTPPTPVKPAPPPAPPTPPPPPVKPAPPPAPPAPPVKPAPPTPPAKPAPPTPPAKPGPGADEWL